MAGGFRRWTATTCDGTMPFCLPGCADRFADRGRRIVGGSSFWGRRYVVHWRYKELLRRDRDSMLLCRVSPLCEALSHMLEGWRKMVE